MDARGGAGAETQAARHHPAELPQRLLRPVELGERAPGVLQQHGAGAGGEGPLAHPLQQGGPAAGLEMPDVQAHRGLAQAQALRRAREAAVSSDLAEGPHVGRIQVHRTVKYS